MLTLCLLLGIANLTHAQEEEGKVKVEISKEIDGKEKTFERSYKSDEEMKNDPELKEFMGDDQQMSFWFDGDQERVIDFQSSGENGFFLDLVIVMKNFRGRIWIQLARIFNSTLMA